MRVLALLALLAAQAAAPRNAGIQGVVRSAGSTAGSLADARVELLAGPAGLLETRTDNAGRFAFTNLPPGSYRIQAGRDGYLRQEFGANGPGTPGTAVVLGAARQAEIAFTLELAPTLSGTVTDENGEPLPRTLIQALRATYDPFGTPILIPMFYAHTDDQGRYRLFWIDPGRYYVSAWIDPNLLFEEGVPPEPVKGGRFGYPPVYHTGLTDPEGITPIEVDAAQEAEGLDFRLEQGPHATVRGAISGPGDVAAGWTVRLVSNGNVRTTVARGAKVNADGTFKIEGVTPGAYLALARAESGQRGWVSIVVVGNSDLNNVRIDTTPSTLISGRLYADVPAPADIREIRIRLEPLESGLRTPGAAKVQADGSFAFEGVEAGRYLVEVTGLPGNAYLKAGRCGDIDPLEQAIAVNGPMQDSLNLLIGVDGGRFNGTVLAAGGLPAAGAQAVLVPDSDRRRRPSQYRIATADAGGAFTMTGIPPGEYTLFAWVRLEPYAYLNAEFISAYANSGVPVHVDAGGHASASITIGAKDRPQEAAAADR